MRVPPPSLRRPERPPPPPPQVVHRDLKSANVLIARDLTGALAGATALVVHCVRAVPCLAGPDAAVPLKCEQPASAATCYPKV